MIPLAITNFIVSTMLFCLFGAKTIEERENTIDVCSTGMAALSQL